MKEKAKGLRSLQIQKQNKVLYYGGFLTLIVIYLIAAVLTITAARTDEVVTIGGYVLPASAFTGVFSSIDNMCIIFMVLFYGTEGFVLSILILLLQFPSMLMGLIKTHSLMSIPGFFVNALTFIAIILIYSSNRKIKKYQESEFEHLLEQQKFSQHLFEQTATALVNAIDAKDTYSHGHSLRVAEYSEKIARQMGKSDEECYRIYYAALLHDVGKIGIDDRIINKNGKLTDEEYEIIKSHPVTGNQILKSISEYPYLSIGAHYHHERFDGKGYPDGLKGEDIPEIARIISVADAYDAMTSTRSYRQTVPQQIAREEIVKYSGSQFDPEIATVMQHIIDLDTDYKLSERKQLKGFSGKNELNCERFGSVISDGIWVNSHMAKITFNYIPKRGEDGNAGKPGIILFDSLDARFHDEEKMIKELHYFEYCSFLFGEEIVNSGVRKIERKVTALKDNTDNDEFEAKEINIEAVRVRDHVLLRIEDGDKTEEITLALPDSARYSYIGLTGRECIVRDVNIERDEEVIRKDYIKRIADEISFIDGPEGDIKNVQIDGYRTDSTEGIELTDGLTITFHTMSLPTARLVWHCPYVSIFSSRDKKVGGEGYKEYAIVRFDGENWDSDGISVNRLIVNKNDSFEGWDKWKEVNKKGYEAVVKFTRKDNKIITTTENFGLFIKETTEITDGNTDIYVALTGDQVALTNIKIKH